MTKILGLKCKECGRTFEAGALHVCDFCFGPLEVSYDYDFIRSTISREKIEQGPLTLWRYLDLSLLGPLETSGPPPRHPPRLSIGIRLVLAALDIDSGLQYIPPESFFM